MTKRLVSHSITLLRIFALGSVVMAGCTLTFAQKRPRPSPTLTIDVEKEEDDKPPMLSMEDEMRVKRALEMEEKNYRNNLLRARNLSILTASLLSSYKEQRNLNEQNLKDLEKAQKLAKSIREAAGGSEDDTKIDDPPITLEAALARLGDTANSLKAKVEKTPKHVISAAVINEANVLLELIRIARDLSESR